MKTKWRCGSWWLACALGWMLAGCDPASELGVDLPPADSVTGTVYSDTLTIRTSTVLVDSVPTSSNTKLLFGRYTDARLGTITARSYARLGLAAGAFEPAATMVYDSLVLLLIPDSYRYGDTSRTQLLQAHRLRQSIRPNTTYYATSSLDYDATPLGVRGFQARPSLDTLRVHLDNALGRELMAAGLNRQLGTDDELEARLPGLVLTPGSADNGAMLRFDPSNAASTLRLYYHSPDNPTAALSYSFSMAGGSRHFYQLQALRDGSPLSSLTTYLQVLPSARTSAEAYIQGGLGLQMKVEIPHLLDLNELGGTRVVNSAIMTLETVSAAENRYFPPPSSLTLYVAGRGNQNVGLLTTADGTQITAPYSRTQSTRTNLDQGTYAFSLTSYCTAVLNRQIDNNGILLAPQTLDSPEQVVIGGSNHAVNPPRFIIYLTRVQ